MSAPTAAGTITEFLIPTSGCQPYGITTGPDGNPWFSEFGAAQIAQFVIGGAAPPTKIDFLIAPSFAFADLPIECDCHIASNA